MDRPLSSPAIVDLALTPTQPGFPRRGSRAPARQGEANDFGWRRQDRMEIGPYAEAFKAVAVASGGTLVLDPSVATVWHVTAAGPLTVSVRVPAFPADAPPGTGRALSLTLVIDGQPGAAVTWTGVAWSQEVRDYLRVANDDPAQPDWTPTMSGRDLFSFLIFPTFTLGLLGGRAFA